jgi:hypothetical protein
MSSRRVSSVLVSLCLLLFALFAACGEPEEEAENTLDSCSAVPVCDVGDTEVSACPDGETCYERAVCNTSILCIEIDNCDLPSQCPAGWSQVHTCDGILVCEGIETCVGPILCGQNEDSCTAEPTCPQGTSEVSVCETPPCQEISECDSTILCQDDPCEEDPSCPIGWDEVDTCDPEGFCDVIEACDGSLLICQDSATCPGIPVCDGDDPEVDPCPAGATCYTNELCDAEILCMSEGPSICGEYYCPDGFSAAVPCTGDDECFLMVGCGDDVFCGGSPAPSPCEAEALCPPGWGPFDGCEDLLDVCALSAVCDSTIECAPQALIDDHLCALVCPDGFTQVDDMATCSTDDPESHCLAANACGTDLFCKADQDPDCGQAYDICPVGYSVVGACDYEDISCFLSLICVDAEYCELD